MSLPNLDDSGIWRQSRLLCDSYLHWTGRLLVPAGIAEPALAGALFHAPFVIVSHDTTEPPVFNYANRAALELFELDWQHFTHMLSRQSAAMDAQAARAELMQRVRREGCIDNCSGVRVTASGRQFRIEGACVWNVVDDNGEYFGQAACFSQWQYL